MPRCASGGAAFLHAHAQSTLIGIGIGFGFGFGFGFGIQAVPDIGGISERKILMAATSRREFMGRAVASSGAAGFLAANATKLRANPLGLPIGCQVYPLHSMLKDFPSFVKTMADIGVTRLELCSPIGYGGDFEALANGNETRKILADHGMKAESSHFSMAELRKEQPKSIEWRKQWAYRK